MVLPVAEHTWSRDQPSIEDDSTHDEEDEDEASTTQVSHGCMLHTQHHSLTSTQQPL
jgi:hypothetical protein